MAKTGHVKWRVGAGEATDQDMLAPIFLFLRLLRQCRLALVTSCILETCMLLAELRVHEHKCLQLEPLGLDCFLEKLVIRLVTVV